MLICLVHRRRVGGPHPGAELLNTQTKVVVLEKSKSPGAGFRPVAARRQFPIMPLIPTQSPHPFASMVHQLSQSAKLATESGPGKRTSATAMGVASRLWRTWQKNHGPGARNVRLETATRGAKKNAKFLRPHTNLVGAAQSYTASKGELRDPCSQA